ncbi:MULTISPECIES: spore germination protein [Lysinibacillus]|uniref:Spore germination protein n=1 Tax=Lysinibacillus antri TaxID=2498145 RepID=A0A3S0P8M7_9BACI|nr:MULTISPECIES: spore germination protein [Lysinibacillus]RUL54002.1 spore germination protein [Lysinibacillus antri]TSI02607.1 spore germination protein [Lysinibacillus sp. BW-2-10]
MTEQQDQQQIILTKLKNSFYNSADFVAKPISWWDNEIAILCFYSSIVNKADVERIMYFFKEHIRDDNLYWGESVYTTVIPLDEKQLAKFLCDGETVVVRLKTKEMIRISLPEMAYRQTDEPTSEHVLQGSREGLVENFDVNLSLIRKRIKSHKLVVKQKSIGDETNTTVYYFYMADLVDEEALQLIEQRLDNIKIDILYSVGQLTDYLEDHVWSPFPQLLKTERSDRIAAGVLEGRIAVISDLSSTALIGPVSFFTFYQTPDDFNGRAITGSFYRMLRIFSFILAIFLPAFYIAVISFHFEILPLELSNQIKTDINNIPYRPILEAFILELTLELIREASIRLPTAVGQTIGIVGGLVIGDAIVNAGLVSNMMVIVVAFTAIGSFVIPSTEMNGTVRIMRFPFMILASFFGFLGIAFGAAILLIHLLNLTSLKRPYFTPLIPFLPKELYKIFIREPFFKPGKQVKSFSPKEDRKL